MIAKHTKRTISALNSRQCLCDPVRVLHGFIFIIKNIPGKYHQIRILIINLFHHPLHLPVSHTITKMQIRNQYHFQIPVVSTVFPDRHFIRFDFYDIRMHDTISTDSSNQCSQKNSHEYISNFTKKEIMYFPRYFLQYQPQDICNCNKYQNVCKSSQPVITDTLYQYLQF